MTEEILTYEEVLALLSEQGRVGKCGRAGFA
jgi:hypothetical protein